MSLNWNDSLLTGVKLIDEQHIELFNLTNFLLTKMGKGKGIEVIDQTYDFLGRYVNEHFTTEESLMIKSDYGDYLFHRGLHRQFVKDFLHLKEKLDAEGATTKMLIKTESWLTGWWLIHIENVNKRLAGFLRSRRAA